MMYKLHFRKKLKRNLLMEHDQEDTCQYWLYPAPDDISDGVSTLAQVRDFNGIFENGNTLKNPQIYSMEGFFANFLI